MASRRGIGPDERPPPLRYLSRDSDRHFRVLRGWLAERRPLLRDAHRPARVLVQLRLRPRVDRRQEQSHRRLAHPPGRPRDDSLDGAQGGAKGEPVRKVSRKTKEAEARPEATSEAAQPDRIEPMTQQLWQRALERREGIAELAIDESAGSSVGEEFAELRRRRREAALLQDEMREFWKSPACRESKRRWRAKPESKKKMARWRKLYMTRPDVRAKATAYNRAWRQRKRNARP